MSSATDELIEPFAAMVKDQGVPIREEDNKWRFERFERKLPKRLPQSFASILSRYSFSAFDVVGVSLLGWDSDSNPYIEEPQRLRAVCQSCWFHRGTSRSAVLIRVI